MKMRHNDVIFLVSETITYDDLGNPIPDTTERLVYANSFGISDQSYFAAAQQGLKPEAQFEIYSFEYAGETKLKHNDKDYAIIRANTKGDKTRITCEAV